jgi:hypothetical protein
MLPRGAENLASCPSRASCRAYEPQITKPTVVEQQTEYIAPPSHNYAYQQLLAVRLSRELRMPSSLLGCNVLWWRYRRRSKDPDLQLPSLSPCVFYMLVQSTSVPDL